MKSGECMPDLAQRMKASLQGNLPESPALRVASLEQAGAPDGGVNRPQDPPVWPITVAGSGPGDDDDDDDDDAGGGSGGNIDPDDDEGSDDDDEEDDEEPLRCARPRR